MAFVEGLFYVQTLHLGPMYLAVISQLAFLQGWPLRGVPLYTVKKFLGVLGKKPFQRTHGDYPKILSKEEALVVQQENIVGT